MEQRARDRKEAKRILIVGGGALGIRELHLPLFEELLSPRRKTPKKAETDVQNSQRTSKRYTQKRKSRSSIPGSN